MGGRGGGAAGMGGGGAAGTGGRGGGAAEWVAAAAAARRAAVLVPAGRRARLFDGRFARHDARRSGRRFLGAGMERDDGQVVRRERAGRRHLCVCGGRAVGEHGVVDTTARNLRLSLTVSAGQYAGGGVSFDSCVDASSFNAISFSASVTSGSLNGCVWQVQLQTQDQRPSNATDPTGGTCNPDGANGCYRYPAATLAMPVAASYVVPFTSFNNPASSTIATAMQVVGVQWQANSASGTGTCTVELHIDDVRFVTQ
jgi:hypothetical protein